MSKFVLDAETGELVLENKSRYTFLPKVPGNSPPHEFIVPESDDSSPDGATHYLIGGDPAVVAQIVAHYAAKGTPVPAGYAEAAAAHVENIAREAAGNAPTA